MEFEQLRVENPKRGPNETLGRAGWYPYYAGYSSRFAYSVLKSAQLNKHTCILDPWNGAGTTTAAAASLGLLAKGYDLNPVMVIIAKARNLSSRVKESLTPIAADISERSTTIGIPDDIKNDSLTLWFTPESAYCVRKFERFTKILLVDEHLNVMRDDLANHASDLAAFFYTVLFRSIRAFLRPFLSSNPTWIKRPKTESDKISFKTPDFQKVFLNEAKYMISTIGINEPYSFVSGSEINIAPASSYLLPDPDSSLDFVLSSPPYCTRIDYAVATLPELALMGYSFKDDFVQLRRNLIGTSTVPKKVGQPPKGWGKTCNDFLEAVKSHESKASRTYYYKNHFQYYESIFRSLGEIKRVLVPKGYCVLVVQDSYYKDIHNNLQQIFIEMGYTLDLHINKRFDFRFNKSLSRINYGSRRYRSTNESTESVLCFVNSKRG